MAPYGGLGRKGSEFSPDEKATEQKLKGYATDSIEIPTAEVCFWFLQYHWISNNDSNSKWDKIFVFLVNFDYRWGWPCIGI